MYQTHRLPISGASVAYVDKCAKMCYNHYVCGYAGTILRVLCRNEADEALPDIPRSWRAVSLMSKAEDKKLKMKGM
jgi:hypothetical protein